VIARLSNYALRNPLDGCFFCDPETWRVAYQGANAQLLAGAGPLCPGYVIVASRRHAHSVAQLSRSDFAEFLSLFHATVAALEMAYGPGYLAYEHGRLGACRMLETANDYSTFCHHAHRVVIPGSTNAIAAIAEHFSKVERLTSAAQLLRYAGQDYVFYEAGGPPARPERYVLTLPRSVQSQFMRRILTQTLRTGREWNWADNIRESEMAETTARVRRAMEEVSARVISQPERLHSSLAIDGLSHVGKTSLARELAAIYRRPVLDTGYFFRGVAFARLCGNQQPTAEEVMPLMLSPDERLRSAEITRLAHEIAREPDVRAMYSDCIRQYIVDLRPCIVVGRDAWRHIHPDEPKLLIEADFETRIHRRSLELLARGEPGTRDDAQRDVVHADYSDAPRLPPPDQPGLARVWNDDAPLYSTVQGVVSHLKGLA
jgi:cytidylate kinase